MSEKGDWIRLLVKYMGKCAECGKEIPQGDYALWSKSSKVIKHVKCDTPASKPVAMPELDCFVCGRLAGCAECGFEADCDRMAVSQVCICNQCLQDKDAYQNYQQAFLAKMQKLARKGL
jgi:hypothetical protein